MKNISAEQSTHPYLPSCANKGQTFQLQLVNDHISASKLLRKSLQCTITDGKSEFN